MKDSLTHRFMLFTTFVVVSIMLIHFTWDYRTQRAQATLEMHEKAQVITKQLIATREVIAKNQDRINYDSQGNFEFKHLNPAAIGMQIGDIFGQLTNYSIKQTRIDYRASCNAPDAFEAQGLLRFGQEPHLAEIWGEDVVEGERVFRYMVPLHMKEECLSCHGQPIGDIDITGHFKEGYKAEDLGGAISLIMPMDIFLQGMKVDVYRHLSFSLLLIGVIVISMYLLVTRLVTRSLGELKIATAQVGQGNFDIDLNCIKAQGEIKELTQHIQEMANQLKDLYQNLEAKVEKRTHQLELVNEDLRIKQDELEAANIKLNEINTYKSEFLAIMSHELRTPLTSVMAFTDLLLQELPKEFIQERQNLKYIKANSQNLLKLINNILDLAKIEAGRLELKLEYVDMADVLGAIDSVVAPLAKKKGIVWEINLAPEVSLLRADPEKLRRVIENLAGNAIKFTPSGGRVEIQVTNTPRENWIIIRVIDTGIGIPPEEQEEIFERFTQVDSSNSRKYGGTGLGLALAKELVTLHKGELWVESEINKGSTFVVYLPKDPDKVD
ncbi:ATP-binding protein [Desulfitobacterium sp. PCE1]|uniref:ATP-binding protein n=1 Tax=Desulfitobacterium sp. PCE1 TaxID=146907 RepID=UPI000485D123|nr:ATP-binding protein [Desulfitobacterium sp. PCE1]